MACSIAMRPDGPRARQRGSLLIEFMVVAVLALLLAVWGSQEWAAQIRVLQARSLAAWMAPARDAVQAYLERHAAQLVQGARIEDSGGADNGDAWADGLLPTPTWDELRTLGLLPSGWQPTGPLGHSLGVLVSRSGACTPSACRVQALVHTRAALLQAQGGLDEALMSEWLMAAYGRGFVLWPRAPDVFSGAGLQIPVHPEGGPWLPGMVALLADHIVVAALTPDGDGGFDPGGEGDGSGATEDFLRVRDTRDPDFQNNLTTQGELRSSTRVVARESVVLEEGWRVGATCAPEGALGRDQAYPGILICQQARWQLVARATGGGYLLNSRRGCRNSLGSATPNPYTGDCFCPAGFSTLQVSESGTLASPEGLTSGYLCLPN